MSLLATLANGTNHGTGTSLATPGNITPAANSILFVFVTGNILFGAPNTPTCSGGGLTYNQIRSDTFTFQTRQTAFWAFTGASPGSFTLTADFAGQANNITLDVVNATGLDNSQPYLSTNTKFDTNTSTTPNCTFTNTFASADNGALAFVNSGAPGSYAAGSGYTLLDSDIAGAQMTEWRADNDTNADATIGNNVVWGETAFELKAIDTLAGFQQSVMPQDPVSVVAY